MKKLLLIPLLFFITPDAKADMDKVCYPSFPEAGTDYDKITQIKNHYPAQEKYIAENCERNNIVRFDFLFDSNLDNFIADWCRHDREIHYFSNGRTPKERYTLVCVLYDNKRRKRASS